MVPALPSHRLRVTRRRHSDVLSAMRWRKRASLKSGRNGKKITSKKQAISVGLSEAARKARKSQERTAQQECWRGVVCDQSQPRDVSLWKRDFMLRKCFDFEEQRTRLEAQFAPSRPTISRLSDGHRDTARSTGNIPIDFDADKSRKPFSSRKARGTLPIASRLVGSCRVGARYSRTERVRPGPGFLGPPNAEGMIHARCHIVADRSSNLDYHPPLPLQRPLTGVMRP